MGSSGEISMGSSLPVDSRGVSIQGRDSEHSCERSCNCICNRICNRSFSWLGCFLLARLYIDIVIVHFSRFCHGNLIDSEDTLELFHILLTDRIRNEIQITFITAGGQCRERYKAGNQWYQLSQNHAGTFDRGLWSILASPTHHPETA